MKSLSKYKEAVEDIIKHSQSYPFDLNCSDIIEKWYQNKKYFIDLFDGETCVETMDELEFYLDDNGKASCFGDFESCLCDQGLSHQTYEGITVNSFLYANKGSFFENKVSVIPEGLEHQSKIRVGDKLIKSLKFFYRDKQELRRAQNLASQYVQKNKVKGKLYLSVDPLDYLLASENNENWRSCHALDGEFRSGNLSYMLDSSTVVAYVSNGEKQDLSMLPEHIKDFSKKLRVFIHWTPTSNVLFFSKTYPFDAPRLRVKIKDCINKLYYSQISQGKILKSDARNFGMPEMVGFNKIELPIPNGVSRRYLDNTWLYFYGNIIGTKEVITASKHALNYNDIIHSSNYTPYVCFESDTLPYDTTNLKEIFEMPIGADVPCARGCGNNIIDSATFICPECMKEVGMKGDFFLHCYDCGRRIWDESDAYYGECWGEEIVYCKRCYVPPDDDEDYYDDDFGY